MLKSIARPITVWLIAGCIGLTSTIYLVAQQAQDKQQPSAQQQKKTTGSAKATPAKTPVKVEDADKLSNEPMSTRGMHRGSSQPSDKSNGQSTSKGDQQSTTKPDSQK
jgi:hypothetical protein